MRLSPPLVGVATGFGLVYTVGLGGASSLALALATSALVILSGVQLILADGLRAYGRQVSAAFSEGRSGRCGFVRRAHGHAPPIGGQIHSA